MSWGDAERSHSARVVDMAPLILDAKVTAFSLGPSYPVGGLRECCGLLGPLPALRQSLPPLRPRWTSEIALPGESGKRSMRKPHQEPFASGSPLLRAPSDLCSAYTSSNGDR